MNSTQKIKNWKGFVKKIVETVLFKLKQRWIDAEFEDESLVRFRIAKMIEDQSLICRKEEDEQWVRKKALKLGSW